MKEIIRKKEVDIKSLQQALEAEQSKQAQPIDTSLEAEVERLELELEQKERDYLSVVTKLENENTDLQSMNLPT